MKQKSVFFGFISNSTRLLFGLILAIPMLSGAQDNTNAQKRPLFSIKGSVIDTPDQDQFLKRLETSNPKSHQELLKISEGCARPKPVPNVPVTLSGKSFSKTTNTDSSGNFEFSNLQAGHYKLSAQGALHSPATDEKRNLPTAMLELNINADRTVTLLLRTDWVKIKGKITDFEGNPVAGAVVTATLEARDPQYLQNHDSPKWTTISLADGSYELQWMEPTTLHRTVGYLDSGSPHSLSYVVVNAQADGFIANDKTLQKIPLVTEEQLALARRLLRIYHSASDKSDGETPMEKENLAFPASTGNTITAVDIVLKKAGKAEQ